MDPKPLPSEIDETSPHWPVSLPLIEITQSAMNSFLTCRQQYVFKYIYKLKKRGFSQALLIGTAVHAAFEILLNPEFGEDVDTRLQAAREALNDVFQKAQDTTDVAVVLNEGAMITAWATADAILESWYIINGTEMDSWSLVTTELSIRAHPEAQIGCELIDRMAGKIDGIVQQAARTCVLEHKTKRSMQYFNPQSLPLDNQCLWYVLIARAHFQSVGRPDLMPTGVLYDVSIKPQHKLNDKGFDDLRKRMVEAMVAAPEKYFLMEPFDVSEEMLSQAYTRFKRIVEQMDSIAFADDTQPGNITMSTARCDDYGGCPFKVLCQNGADANDPRTVFNAPGIDMFEFADLHSELMEAPRDDE